MEVSQDVLQEKLQEVSEAVEDKIDQLLPGGESETENVISLHGAANDTVSAPTYCAEHEGTIIEAMRYSALAGGKRLRPFLTVMSAKLFGVSLEASLRTAAAIEFVHTYSLIHDDLPAMDDDDLRRGKPACHIKFGEAAAILAGDALLSLAFEVLAHERVHYDPKVRCELITALAKASGYNGMVAGQMLDLEAENEKLSIDEIIRLQRLKTGEMFAVSCEAGAILGKAPTQLRNALRRYAHDMGLAFQIRDDLLDAEGKREETGKEVGKDHTAGKATLVSVLGAERAREQSQILATQAVNHLDVFDKNADILRSLVEFVIKRRS
jgi:farnesyl diphosphate synthase